LLTTAWIPEDSYEVPPQEQSGALDMSLNPATEYEDPVERSRAQYRAAVNEVRAEREAETDGAVEANKALDMVTNYVPYLVS
jgi:hypothetical protein